MNTILRSQAPAGHRFGVGRIFLLCLAGRHRQIADRGLRGASGSVCPKPHHRPGDRTSGVIFPPSIDYKSRSRGTVVLRAGLMPVAWLLFYNAARHLGLAELTTLYFSAPVMVIFLSILVLKEKVRLCIASASEEAVRPASPLSHPLA